MGFRGINDVERLRKIIEALMGRVERSTDQQGNAFSLFQTAIALENRVRQRTEELTFALRRLETSNRALLSAKDIAERANLSKTRFLAAASHDVLQPLNAANLSISALADHTLSGEARLLVEQIERALHTMDDLLRTLLDISKLDAGVLTPKLSAVALQPLFQSLHSDFAPLAAARGLKLRFRATDAVILTDRSMFRRILQNIISNGLRYTNQGGVLVGAGVKDSKVAVTVNDTGIGIDADDEALIYEEFQRGAQNGEETGAGLGLAIVRRMVDALGHTVSHRSRPGRGTRFTVTAASAPRPSPTSKVEPPVGAAGASLLKGLQVLLVENDAQVRMATISLLNRWGCATQSASASDEALRLVQTGSWLPDVLIADQHLDHGDLGSETISAVRAAVGHPVPALIVTADPSEELAATARSMGLEVIRKPIKPAALRALLEFLIRPH